MPLPNGTRLGAYEVQSALGAGGMGEVYRAKDTKLGRDVALKILPASFTNDPERVARFRREAQVLASLNHPHVAQIHGLEEVDGTQFLVLELVDGESLDKRIARGRIPVEETLEIAKQIAEALEVAHEKGIIHRDLKPANIALAEDGQVKVLDFGLAKATEPASGASLDVTNSPTITTPAMMTGVGVILGTAPYMSPEQAKGRAADKRSDIWAFGCVLYEMLTGKRAFEGDDVSDTLANVLKSEPEWAALPGRTPVPIHRLLRRCLAKDRGRRLESAADAQLDVDEAQRAPQAQSSYTPRPNRLVWTVASAAITLTAVWTFTQIRHATTIASSEFETRLEVTTPPSNDPFSFAISPDGRKLVFVANGPRGSQLWLRPFDQAVAQPIAATDSGDIPFWKPDSRVIGFFADGKLKRIDLAGGAPIVLANAPVGRGGSWNADDVIVFAPTSNSGLMRVPANCGPSTPLTKLEPGQGSHRWPQFLPDGHHVLFTSGLGQPEKRGTYVVALDGGQPMRIESEAADMFADGYLLSVSRAILFARLFDSTRFSTAGERRHVADSIGSDAAIVRNALSVSSAGVLAYRSGSATKRELRWFDRAGRSEGENAVVTAPQDTNLAAPQLSLDGRRVVFNQTNEGNADVFMIDLTLGVTTRLTFDEALDLSPVLSPDGKRVAFRSSRNGNYDLFVKSTDLSTDDQLLLKSPLDKSPLDWSRDGKFLLYSVQDEKAGSDLWVLPLTGDNRQPFAAVKSPFDDIEGQFSPDGNWLAYASNQSGTGYQIYVQPLAGGSRVQISTSGGTQPRWSGNGREIFYLAGDNRLMSVPITAGAEDRSLKPGTPQALFFVHLVASGANIGSAGFSARTQYGVAGDGRFLINVTADQGAPAPITIVLNWTAAIKK